MIAIHKNQPLMQDPLEYASQIAYSSKKVLQFSYDMAVKYKDTPGVYVECGVAAGAQIIAMLAGSPGKEVHAFDSFEGIPMPSNKDNQMPGIKFLQPWEIRGLPNPGEAELKTTGATAVTEASFLEHVMSAFEGDTSYYKNLYTHPGWFEITMTQAAQMISPISILRLDGDLYNSTYICLKYLYPKVIKGGLVIIDDIQLPGCHTACEDYFKLIDYRPDYKTIDNIAYFIK